MLAARRWDPGERNCRTGLLPRVMTLNRTSGSGCRMRAGEQAPIMDYPIFVGLNVGSEGVAFRCHTVNVRTTATRRC